MKAMAIVSNLCFVFFSMPGRSFPNVLLSQSRLWWTILFLLCRRCGHMENAAPRFFSMFHILAARRNAFLNSFGISADFSILRFEKRIHADGVCLPSTFLFEKSAWPGNLREIHVHNRAAEAVRSMLKLRWDCWRRPSDRAPVLLQGREQRCYQCVQ